MILNVIRESEYTDNNTIESNITNDEKVDKVQLKKIKSLIDESQLRYVSENVRHLLGIKKENDKTCFDKQPKVIKRVVQAGEKFRVILYIRLSQEDGDLEIGDVSGSIKNQLLYLLDECRKRDWIVVGIFCEEDISGCDDNRPEWLKSIRFAEVGNTEIVLCKSQSRFTRSMEMVEKYLHTCFPEWNVRFLGLVDNADTDVVENKKQRQITGLTNEWFVEDTSKSTRASLNSMKRNGQFTGSFAPYGYIIDPNDKHHLLSDPYARGAIQIMAGMLKHGKSIKSIIEVLMRKRYLTPADYKTAQGSKICRGKNRITKVNYQVEEGDTLQSIANKFYITKEEIKQNNNLETNKVKVGDVLVLPYRQRWTAKMIKTILTDETQIGTLVQGKTERTSFKNKKPIQKSKEEWIRVPHCHEANLDLQTFETVSAMFKDGKNTRNYPQANGELPLFSKKVYCSCCGKTFSKSYVHLKSGDKIYLKCRGCTNTLGKICDNTASVNFQDFKEYILDAIKEKISDYFDKTKLSKEYYLQNVYENIDNDINEKEKIKLNTENEIQKKKNILVQLYSDKASGALSLEEFMIIKNSNTLEIERLENRLSELNTDITNLNLEKAKQVDKEEIFNKYKNITDLNKTVLDAFIDRIEIGKKNLEDSTRSIDIKWNLYTA